MVGLVWRCIFLFSLLMKMFEIMLCFVGIVVFFLMIFVKIRVL